MLIDHLTIDAEEMLRAALYGCLDAISTDLLRDIIDQLLYIFITFLSAGRNLLHQVVIGFRFQITKRQIVEFDLHLGDTESLSQRRIDLHRLLSLLLLLGRRHIAKSTHIMQSVGKLDQDDTDILRHGKEHLTEILCLNFYLILIVI